MIAIIDYDAGNIKSVEKALKAINQDVILTRDHDEILSAEKVILPGVGSFGDAMSKLNEYGLVDIIRKVASKGTPLLGICMGLQLMFECSDESADVAGIGLFKGSIKHIPATDGIKIPHIGWNSINLKKDTRLFRGIPDNSYVYFVHSYYLKAEDENIVAATTEYGTHIHAAIESGNVFACQFHPEKSSDIGLKILMNFAAL